MTSFDPVREQVRSLWQALARGEASRQDAVAWAHLQLSDQAWTDEVTHDGLQHLGDYVHESWTHADAAVGARVLAHYERWIEEVRAFERDPAAWNHQWALAYLQRLPPALRMRAAVSFAVEGFLSEDEVEHFRD
ncbi:MULTISPECIES: hypothetical protein [Microbacterium]|uniref:hypothetical protein n=1 Tax=Microbacterium TaxID=33882 RepID=UPI00277E7E15|nr:MULTISPECIES: hypothetical protein [Microbacterium]MDQ1083765.1 hypothetical protein [Microbacterium sp. SORGH_AS_0344]MDQ1170957.1 hypothetical protein [Microbacterium proteolyticum]